MDVTEEEWSLLNQRSPWLGNRCYSHGEVVVVGTDPSSRWRRVINLAISCTITSLLILPAALVLGIVGVLYRQATCIMVDAVLFQLSAFFALFGMIIHYSSRVERRRDLASPCSLNSLCAALQDYSGWASYMGAGAILCCLASALAVYAASCRLRHLINTVPDFR